MISPNDLVNLFENKRKKIKINSHYRRLPFAASMFLLVVVFITIGIVNSPAPIASGSGFSRVISTTLSGPDLKNLNFKNVQRFEVPNATKTVIYIPQIHREPTSNQADSTNDQALVIQREIASMLKTLVDDNHVTYVMDETDNFGPMPADKIQKIKTGVANITKLRADVKSLADHYVKDGGSADTAKTVVSDANTKIDGYERAIYLTGGAAVLAGTDSNAHVYGSQNPATIAEATKQLQNIVFIEQRISQLDPSTASSASSGSQANILSMLGSSSGSSNASPIQSIKDFAAEKQDKEMQSEIDKITAGSKAISGATNYETTPAVTTVGAQPQTNPYTKETNLAKLKQMNQDATAKFMKLAKDQRSQEVSDNIDKMMQENGQTTVILVMGAQHQDQLVSDLNKKGISVIVITPESEVGVPAAVPSS